MRTLQEAATQDVAYEDVNPYAFLCFASSPHIAAKHDGVVVDEAVLSAKLEGDINKFRHRF